jgi:hypothetical protein
MHTNIFSIFLPKKLSFFHRPKPVKKQFVNAAMRQCGNVGRRAMRCGAPAVTPSVSAQAGNARFPMPNASRSVIAALPNYRIG